MEELLTVYLLPHNPLFPIVCMDESSKQLVAEVHEPIAAAPGRGQIIDHEYVRHGVATLIAEVEPLAGRSPSFSRTTGNPLHSKTWQLAQHR